MTGTQKLPGKAVCSLPRLSVSRRTHKIALKVESSGDVLVFF